MIEFNFVHEGNNIRLVNTYYGREKVYFNDALITNNINWRSTNIHDFEVENSKYRISIRLNSALNCDVTVKLFVNETLIEAQTKTVDNLFNLEGLPAFSDEETLWKKEIEMSKVNQVLTWVLYFSLFFLGLSKSLIENETLQIVFIMTLISAVAYSIWDFFKTTFRSL